MPLLLVLVFALLFVLTIMCDIDWLGVGCIGFISPTVFCGVGVVLLISPKFFSGVGLIALTCDKFDFKSVNAIRFLNYLPLVRFSFFLDQLLILSIMNLFHPYYLHSNYLGLWFQ